MLEQAPGRACGPVESRALAGAGLLAEFVTLWKGSMLELFEENCSLWVGPHAGTGEEHEKEGEVGLCDKLTAPPIPCLCTTLGQEVEK